LYNNALTSYYIWYQIMIENFSFKFKTSLFLHNNTKLLNTYRFYKLVADWSIEI